MVKRLATLTIALMAVLPPAVAATVLPAPAMYADAVARDQAVRQALEAAPSAALLKAVRTAILAYESVVRHYPTSGYCDDALWNAARLAIDVSKPLKDATFGTLAARLLKRLTAEYPTSRFARQAPGVLARLDIVPAAAAPPPVAVNPPRIAPVAPALPAPPAAAAASRPLVMLRSIKRTVLPDVVRVTIDLDGEVPVHQEELTGPARLFFDFSGTKAAADLAERTIRFDGEPDIVRQVRVGRQPNDTVRVVLDTTGAASCSVAPLYTPYRLVVECVRESGPPGPTAVPVKRPMPVTPATFARKAPAVMAPPPAPLTAHVTVSPMAAPAVLLSTVIAPPLALAARLPVGPSAAAATVVTAIASEPATIPAATNIPAATAKQPMRAPLAPARNLGGGFSMARQLGLKVSRIVIDPGHGGHDPGARGSGITEAALVLDIALRLEKLLLQEPGTEVFLTRRVDEFIALEERTAIANREAADLFLSIHTNASSIAQAAGVETYFLNFANTVSAASVAARENAASGQPMNALPDFVKAIALNNKADESKDFATQVQRSLVQKLRTANQNVRDLGVKQAPFVVLIGASMPSALAEVSFVTNDQEGKLLKGPNYRQRIAEGLFAAVQRYQAALNRLRDVAQP